MGDVDSEHVAPPDLPAEMLTEVAVTAPSSGPAVSPPGPDFPDAMLSTAQPTAAAPQEVDGPDIAAELLVAHPADEAGAVPAAPTLDPAAAAEPPVPATAGAEPIGPSESVPLGEEAAQFREEPTFEEKWDSLARQLRTSSTLHEGAVSPVPPDLPDEMLRPAGDTVPEGGEYEEE